MWRNLEAMDLPRRAIQQQQPGKTAEEEPPWSQTLTAPNSSRFLLFSCATYTYLMAGGADRTRHTASTPQAEQTSPSFHRSRILPKTPFLNRKLFTSSTYPTETCYKNICTLKKGTQANINAKSHQYKFNMQYRNWAN